MIASKPEVTVIIPTYNRANFIKDAIKSVLAQEASFEIIIIDDYSTDNTVDIVHSFQDSRIRYFRLKEKSGAQIARNMGIKQAKGKLITFLDSDDIFLSDTLVLRSKYFDDHPECECSYSDFEVYVSGKSIKHTKRIKFNKNGSEGNFKSALRVLRVAPTSVFMARRDVLINSVGFFDTTLPCGHDDDIYLRFAKRGHCHYVPHFAARLVSHEGDQIAKSKKRLALGYEMLIAKYKKDILDYLGEPELKKHLVADSIEYLLVGNFSKFLCLQKEIRKDYGVIPVIDFSQIFMVKIIREFYRYSRNLVLNLPFFYVSQILNWLEVKGLNLCNRSLK